MCFSFSVFHSFASISFCVLCTGARGREGVRELKCCLFYCHFPLYPAAAIYSSFYTEINGQWTDFIRNNRVSYIVQWNGFPFFSLFLYSFPFLQFQCVHSCEHTHTSEQLRTQVAMSDSKRTGSFLRKIVIEMHFYFSRSNNNILTSCFWHKDVHDTL